MEKESVRRFTPEVRLASVPSAAALVLAGHQPVRVLRRPGQPPQIVFPPEAQAALTAFVQAKAFIDMFVQIGRVGRSGTNSRALMPEPDLNEEEDMSDIAERVKKIVVEHLSVDESKVTESASFIDDLGADSLDTVELVMAFEEEFGVEIPDDAAEKISTVGDAIKFIQENAKS